MGRSTNKFVITIVAVLPAGSRANKLDGNHIVKLEKIGITTH